MNSIKKNLLILTSSFPRHSGDSTCAYIRDFARSVAVEFDIQVLAPPDSSAARWQTDAFCLKRSRSILGSREIFQGSRDLNDLSSQPRLLKLGLFVSIASFLIEALRLARTADVICSHWLIPSGLIGSLAACILGKPHVVIEHSGALHLLRTVRGGRWLTRFIVRRSQAVVVVSSDLRNKLIALCPEARGKVRVVPMGTDVNLEEDRHEPEIREGSGPSQTILFVGRLVEIKGLQVLLHAIEGVEGWRLLIAGEGRLRSELEQLAEELRVDARFIGRVDAEERSRLFRIADVVVIPSLLLDNGRTEGTAVVCLEALAAGRAVICSRVGGLPEIITDGENGLLVDPGDHQQLRERLKAVLTDQRLRDRLSVSARRSAVRYDWTKVGVRFAKIIKDSLTKNVENGSVRGF
jgi:phosphatidyl-myo-inositol dimannoside synthase